MNRGTDLPAASSADLLPLAESMEEEPSLIEVHVPYEGRPIIELAASNWDLYNHNSCKIPIILSYSSDLD